MRGNFNVIWNGEFCDFLVNGSDGRAHAIVTDGIVCKRAESLKMKGVLLVRRGLLTSRAETNCRGLSALFMSGMLDSRS